MAADQKVPEIGMLKSASRGCFLPKTVRSDLVLALRKMSYTSARVKAMALFVKHEAKFEGKHKGNPFHKIDNPQVRSIAMHYS